MLRMAVLSSNFSKTSKTYLDKLLQPEEGHPTDGVLPIPYSPSLSQEHPMPLGKSVQCWLSFGVRKTHCKSDLHEKMDVRLILQTSLRRGIRTEEAILQDVGQSYPVHVHGELR